MPFWHFRGKQNSRGEAYSVTPAAYLERAEKFNIDWNAAFDMIDKGDQEGLNADVWDDPKSSRDTAAKGRARSSVSRSTPERTVGDQIGGIRALIGMLLSTKWIVGGIVVILLAKFLWPAFKALL